MHFPSKSRRSLREAIRAIVFISERERPWSLSTGSRWRRQALPITEDYSYFHSIPFSLFWRSRSHSSSQITWEESLKGVGHTVTTIWPDAVEISGLKVLIKVQICVMKQTLNSLLWEFITERVHCWDILLGHSYNVINTDTIFRDSSEGPSNRRSTTGPVLRTSNAPSRGSTGTDVSTVDSRSAWRPACPEMVSIECRVQTDFPGSFSN